MLYILTQLIKYLVKQRYRILVRLLFCSTIRTYHFVSFSGSVGLMCINNQPSEGSFCLHLSLFTIFRYFLCFISPSRLSYFPIFLFWSLTLLLLMNGTSPLLLLIIMLFIQIRRISSFCCVLNCLHRTVLLRGCYLYISQAKEQKRTTSVTLCHLII